MPTWDERERARREEEERAAREAMAASESAAPRGMIWSNTGNNTRVRNWAAERARDLQVADDRRRAAMDADPTYTPDYAFEDVVDGGPSAFGGAAADAGSVEAQRRALDMMREQAETRGFTPAEQAMMQANVRQAEQSARGQRMADMQALEARGMGGSGMAMLSGQMAADSAADRAADVGAQGMMSAQQRALAAMESYGGQAAQMRGQSFGESATRAGGLDAWNQALAQRAQGVEGRNAERYNQAQDQGFQNRFQREALSQGLYGMEQQRAENARDRAQQTREGERDRDAAFTGALIGGVSNLVGSMGGM